MTQFVRITGEGTNRRPRNRCKSAMGDVGLEPTTSALSRRDRADRRGERAASNGAKWLEIPRSPFRPLPGDGLIDEDVTVSDVGLGEHLDTHGVPLPRVRSITTIQAKHSLWTQPRGSPGSVIFSWHSRGSSSSFAQLNFLYAPQGVWAA